MIKITFFDIDGTLLKMVCKEQSEKLYVYLYSNPFGAPNLIIGNFYDK